MYSFQLNIGSVSTPVIGGGWVTVEPFYNSASINKALEDLQIYARIKLEGQMGFKGSTFTALDSLRVNNAKCDIRVLHTPNGGTASVIHTGEVDLWGEYKENVCTLKVESDDEYTLLDTDKSKKYNDENGHQEGDILLKKLASLIRENTRKQDIAARYGGDEFSIILPNANKKKAKMSAERLRKHFSSIENKKITISLGIASFPKDAKTPQKLIVLADKMLYSAKKEGKNKVKAK